MTSLVNIRRATFVLVAAMAWMGCKQTNRLYCDVSTPCRDPARPSCDTIAHECQSASSTHPDMSTVDMSSGCSTSDQCPDALPICDAGVCRACTGPADAALCTTHKATTPYCDIPSGACVACTTATQATDCAAATPICGVGGGCRKCQLHSECAEGVCRFDGPNAGSCVASSEIAYVDNKGNVTNCGLAGTHDGASPATAYCDVQPGVDSGKPYVLVTGHGNTQSAYGKVTITNTVNVTIVGPGAGVLNPALVFDVAADQISVTPTGSNAATLILDGLELGDRSNPSGQNGISCSASGAASAKIVVRRSIIQHNGKMGVTTNGCDVTLDQSTIGPGNSQGGALLKSSDFTIQNSVVHDNGSTTAAFGGLQINGLGAAARGRIVNVDIVNNASKNAANTYSAIDCVSGTVVALNTALIGNTVAASTAEVRSSCLMDHSAWVGAAGTNLNLASCSDATVFVDPTAFDYHLRTAAVAPCTVTLVGRGTGAFMNASAPDYDFYGASRPLPAGSAADIGAVESPQ
ncbi:MAG: hypothetical protein JWN44_5875 [Myxococcales bacterium]|nr:hypothetical protein [Myxococcales bacterium]